MGHSPSRPPLQPDITPELPPWANKSIFAPKYTGRKCYWTELGYEDPVHKAGYYRNHRPFMKEHDEYWFDPKVPDGTSITGPNGLDSKYHKNVTYKLDTPGNFYDFHRKVMVNSPQYKNIAKKFDISEEHPGIDVSPNLSSLDWSTKLFGAPNWLYHGPRFWDKPLNEGCVTKGLALAKLGAIFTLPFTIGSLINYPVARPAENQTISLIAKRYFSMAWLPAVLGFSYGVTVCTVSNVRDKDDSWNWAIASGMMGFTLASIKDNIPKGVIAFLVTGSIGYVYHMCRCDYKGLQGLEPRQDSSYWNQGPLGWKMWQFGTVEVPREKW
ncbi:tim17/Tim22/Tim23/Pmp24 family domain-containing protein [Ditylenchus destructor]|nr:tim17/Tim22/Tim23/Pmp24 family domain-containing protein [Ditylenchus destructor]